MKRYKVILAGMLLGLSLTGCEGFLDREPWDSIDATKGFQSEGEAVAAVNGAYQPLQWAKLYNMRMWTLDIVAGNSVVGAGGGTDGIETVQLSNFITTSDNFGVLDLYRATQTQAARIRLKEEESLAHRRSVENASEMFRLTYVGFLEVLSAEERYLDSELEYVDIVNDFCQKKILLYRALGGGSGWE